MKNSKREKKHLLIIGGTGFIGYHCLNFAKKYRWKLTSISRNFPQRERKVSGVKYLKLNINNLGHIQKKLSENFTFVINAVGVTNKNLKRNKKNIISLKKFKKLIDFFYYKKINKFIQIGSAAEYGSEKIPQKENMTCKPKSQYGQSKLEETKYLLNYLKFYSFNATIVRLFQVYGRKQNNDKIIAYTLEKCLSDKEFKLTEGSQTRDFCHINDIMRGIFLLLSKKKSNGEIYNIASGQDTSIKKLTQTIVNIVGQGKPIFGALRYRQNEIFKSRADIKKIKKLGWKPKINLQNGIKSLLK